MSDRAPRDSDPRLPLAEAVLAANGVMPDADRHRGYLMRLGFEALRERLARLQGDPRSEAREARGRTWMDRAVQKARAFL